MPKMTPNLDDLQPTSPYKKRDSRGDQRRRHGELAHRFPAQQVLLGVVLLDLGHEPKVDANQGGQ